MLFRKKKIVEVVPVEVKEPESGTCRACPGKRLLALLFGILCPVIGILFIVYFWNIDQKIMTMLYRIVNEVFDEKKVDLNF